MKTGANLQLKSRSDSGRGKQGRFRREIRRNDGCQSGDGGKLVFRKKVSRNGAGGKVGAGAELFAGLSAFEEGTSRMKNLC